MIKLIYLLALAALTYFSLKSMFRAPRRPLEKNETAPPRPMNFPEAGDMAQDPVCGTYVDPASALYLIHEDRKYYFCSETCKKKFPANSKPETTRREPPGRTRN